MWEDVAEGEVLPPVSYELNLTRMVAFVRATGLYDYIHFDRDYAQSVGMRDAFMGTPHIVGLVCRLLTDWAGPDARVRSLALDLGAPCCRGDMLTVSGRVGRKYRNDADDLVDIGDIVIAHAHSAHAVTGTATLALASTSGGPAADTWVGDHAVPAVAGADVPAFAQGMIGNTRAGPHDGTRALTEHEIRLWCECLEDWNPLYCDPDYGRPARSGGIVAPPGLSWFFGAGTGVEAGIGYAKPGTAVPAPIRRGLTGLPLLQELREGLMVANSPFTLDDFPEAVVRNLRDHFFRPIRPGDALRDGFELLDCSARRKTRLGEGHFVTFAHWFHNMRDEPVRRQTLTLFHFRSSEHLERASVS